jgi:hypothetical protein
MLDLRSIAARIRASASRDNLGSTLAFVIDLLWGRSYFEDAPTVIEPKYSHCGSSMKPPEAQESSKTQFC